MIEKERFSEMIQALKEKLDPTQGALIAEDILALQSAFNESYDENQSIVAASEKLKADNEELLKVNGRLFQKIGFDKKEDETKEVEKIDDEKVIEIESLINEKGEII